MAKAKKVSKVVSTAVITMVDPKTIRMDLAANRQGGMGEEGIKGLADSIRQCGLLQPVMLNKVGDDLHCVYGHRRTLAAQQIENFLIPAIIREGMTEKDVFIARVTENEQSEDTSPIDKAKSIQQAKEIHGMSQNEIADMMGQYPADISRTLSLLKLSAELQDKVHRNQLTVQAALSLVPAAKTEQAEVVAKIEEVVAPLVAEGASDAAIKRATAEIVQTQNAKPGTTTKPVRPVKPKAQPAPKGNIQDIAPPVVPQPAPAPATKKGKDEPAEVSPVQKNLKMYEDLLDLLCRLEDATEGKIKKIFGKMLDMVDGSATAEDVLDLVG